MDTSSNFKVIGDGTVACATPGTAVQFNSGTSQACRLVRITALAENKGAISIGASTTKATSGVARGMQLAPGQSADFPVADLNLLYLDALNAGDAASFLYFRVTE